MKEHFIIIDFDGWNVGIKGAFCQTYLVFTSFEDAVAIAKHWDEWCEL